MINKFLFQSITEATDFLTPIDKDIPKGKLFQISTPTAPSYQAKCYVLTLSLSLSLTHTHTLIHTHTHTHMYTLLLGCWSLQCDQGGTCAVLRSLQWLGLVAYHVPNTPNFGYFYCGTGEKNPDLLFMLQNGRVYSKIPLHKTLDLTKLMPTPKIIISLLFITTRKIGLKRIG